MISLKEHIYTIPITDALNEECGCVLCSIEKKLESEAITYFLGASLMEPDAREDTNKNGFCRPHTKMLYEGGNSLGLSLILETHIKEFSKNFVLNEKTGLFKKPDTKESTKKIDNAVKSCSVCNKLNSQMEAVARNLIYLISKEKDFKEKFFEKGALCAEHASLVLSLCEKELGAKKGTDLYNEISAMQRAYLEELYNNLHAFVISFDYRSNGEKPSEKVKASLGEAVKYISKY